MPSESLTVNVKGLDALILKLGHVTDPVKEMVEDAGKYAWAELKISAKPHAGDKGTIGKASKFEFGGAGVALQARISPAQSMKGIARVIEEGRKPGKGPPFKAIEKWGLAHGMAPKTGWKLRSAIKTHGTKGVFMFAKAAEATSKHFPGLLKKAAAAVEKAWGAH